MEPTPSPEAIKHIAVIAAERGIHPDTLLVDFFNADSRFRKVSGRTVVCSEGGVPALADKCNELLALHPDSELAIRKEILRIIGLKITDVDPTMAAAIVAIGRRKKARDVIAAWNCVLDIFRPTT